MTEQPWERRDDESTPAFEAFRTYRDMGTGRSVDAVACRLGGAPKGSKRAPGRLTGWSVAYEWVSRARAWDDHMDRVRREGEERATRREGEEWAKRKTEWARREWAVASRLLSKVEALSRFPIARETRTETQDGQAVTTVYEPIDAQGLRRAALIAREAAALARGAFDLAIPPADSPAAAPPVVVDPEVSNRAIRELKEWQQTMALKVTHPPDEPTTAA